MKNYTTNSHGTNVLIKAQTLPYEEMRKIGFTDYAKDRWYYCRLVKFPNNKKYRNFEISFNVTIPKDGSEMYIDVLDEDFCQPYDYQMMLRDSPLFEPCLIVRDFVEEQMEHLQNSGVFSGHVKGEYI